VKERQRDVEGVLKQYIEFVKPSLEKYVRRQTKVADVVVPRGVQNVKAIEMITQDIANALKRKSEDHLQSFEEMKCTDMAVDCASLPNIVLLPQTPQLLAMLTVVRDQNTSREEFVFSLDRVGRLLLERALDDVPYESKFVTTPTGATYNGLEQSCKICAVSIQRGGQPLESAFRKTFDDPAIGKMLIQSDTKTGEPQLHSLHLPRDIKSRHVFLMDAQIASAYAVLLAIRVLIDHGVKPEKLYILSILTASEGLHTLAKVYPDVRVFTSSIDQNTKGLSRIVVPGAGNIGSRWHGA
jgi:uridine kinase